MFHAKDKTLESETIMLKKCSTKVNKKPNGNNKFIIVKTNNNVNAIVKIGKIIKFDTNDIG